VTGRRVFLRTTGLIGTHRCRSTRTRFRLAGSDPSFRYILRGDEENIVFDTARDTIDVSTVSPWIGGLADHDVSWCATRPPRQSASPR
jgi:hypothetical protein